MSVDLAHSGGTFRRMRGDLPHTSAGIPHMSVDVARMAGRPCTWARTSRT